MTKDIKTESRKKKYSPASEIAEAFGVSSRYVRMVASGARSNPRILETYNQYKEGKNKLIKAIEKAVKIA